MNRNLYLLAIYLMVLNFVTGLFQSFLYFQIGGRSFFLESFPVWFVVMSIIYFGGLWVLLKYFQYRNFQFASIALIVVFIVSFCHFIIIYGFTTGKSFGRFYSFTAILVLGATILHAISLIFSSAGSKPWLKSAGIFTFIFGLVLTTTLILGINSQDVQFRATLEKIQLVASTAGNLAFILFIMNFLSEIKILKSEDPASTRKKFSESSWIVVVMIAFVSTFFVGGMVAKESNTAKYWDGQNARKTNEFAQRSEERTYTGDDGSTLKYLLMKPLEYDPQQNYPLVVSLPYGGYQSPPAQWLAEYNNRERYPAFLFVPYCPEGAGWGGIPNYPTIDTLVFEAIEALEKEVTIDTKRIYVSGVSRGAYGSWHFITTRPDMFAAAVPVCGGGNPELGANIVDVSVWAFHGEKDRNVPVSGSRNMIEAIKNAGGDPKYTEFAGAGHNIWHDVTTTSGLLDWLFAQKRE